ncbi:hypothetical protein DPMN_026841 [Dreissena polymorpha]|uniref:Uncharacterized protein n=1 Tax=Dreissena polymorpha TaxID=45954 RepID=A0A9D4LU67_DREPO|nr:hypothetical protein DPMN_026841 [Dreissena polymorpha]
MKTVHIRPDPAYKPCSSVSFLVDPRTSGIVLGYPRGKHDSFGKLKTAVLIRDKPKR